MRISHLFLTLGMLCASVGAAAQWQWIDKDGRKIFSDRAPPADVPDQNILKQPGRAAATSGSAAAGDSSTAGKPQESAPKPAATPVTAKSDLDKKLEEKKKQAEKDEAAQRKAEEDRVAAARADNCQRAKQALPTYQSGVRITRNNAQGERVFLDDAARAAETTRLQGIIASDCRQ